VEQNVLDEIEQREDPATSEEEKEITFNPSKRLGPSHSAEN